MPKEFKTIEELVELLRRRGVVTDDATSAVLRRESYYAVVNGYKEPFLDRDAMQSSSEDVYKQGTTFASIHDLFLFDRALRNLSLPHLISAETIIKNAVVYSFCHEHRQALDYLDARNYVDAKSMLVPPGFKGNKAAAHRKNLKKLISILEGKTKLGPETKPYVRHYIERYGQVPLWVLQNDLTFGNISHFYQLQKRGVQNAACRTVAEVNGNGRRIGARDLLDVTRILVDYRNTCAHDERLYCARLKGHGFDHMLDALSMIVPHDEMVEFQASVFMVLESFRGRVHPSALNAMYTDPKDIPAEFI